MRTSSPPGVADRASVILLCAAVIVLPLARGAVDPTAQLAGLLLCAAAFVVGTARSTTTTTPVILLVGALGFSLIQVVPLPSVVHFLSPVARHVFESTLAPLARYPAVRPLSLDPPASAREFGVAVTCVAAFATSVRIADTVWRKRLLGRALATSGLIVAGVVLSRAALGTVLTIDAPFPFVNPNHLAGFCNLCAFAALGLALSRRSRGARIFWLLASVLISGTCFFSLSRGGILAFVVGILLFVMLARRQEYAALPRRKAAIWGGVAAGFACAVLLGTYLDRGSLLREIGSISEPSSVAKVAAWRMGLAVLRSSPLVGIGRGAFPSVSAGFQTEGPPLTFTHVENEWLQPLVDLGVPGGLLVLAPFVWTWIAAARRRNLNVLETGLLAGVGAVALQNIADFSLELPGVAIPFCVALGLVARDIPVRTVSRALTSTVSVGVVLLGVVGVFYGVEHDLDRDATSIAASPSLETAMEAAIRATELHPADYIPPATIGARLIEADQCSEGLPWIMRAMALNPIAPEPHAFAARCLVAASQDASAKREFRLAVLLGDADALAYALQRYPALEDMLDIAPDTPDGRWELAGLLARSRSPDAEAVFRVLWTEFYDERALLPLALLAAQRESFDEAREYARLHISWKPNDSRGYAVVADCLFRSGQEQEAVQHLQLGLARIPGSLQLSSALAEHAKDTRHFVEATSYAEGIRPHTPEDVAAKHRLLADILLAEGRLLDAISQAQQSAAVLPDSPDSFILLSQLFLAARRYSEAEAALLRARALGAEPSRVDSLLAQVEAARKGAAEHSTSQLPPALEQDNGSRSSTPDLHGE